jgi:hypothetical protein
MPGLVNLQAIIEGIVWLHVCIGLCVIYIAAVACLIAYAYGRKSALPRRDWRGRFSK